MTALLDQAVPLLVFIVAAAAVAGLAGAALARANRPSGDAQLAAQEALVSRVEDCLPRTQCAQCGYPGCRPYAQAILADEVGIDRCPPGGDATIRDLARLLDRPIVPLAPGLSGAKAALPDAPPADAPRVARIVEADCIGCALCLPACPTDAIVGAARFMHTVIDADCTGCELCLAPCPVDCIRMVPA